MPNLIVISFTLMYPVFVLGVYCKGCVIVRESVKTQAIEVRRIFTGISQLSIPRKSGVSVQWPVSLDVLDTWRVQSWTHVTYPTHPVATDHWTEAKYPAKRCMCLAHDWNAKSQYRWGLLCLTSILRVRPSRETPARHSVLLDCTIWFTPFAPTLYIPTLPTNVRESFWEKTLAKTLES